MERPGVIVQEAAAAPTDQEHVAPNRKLPHELLQGVEVALMWTPGAEALQEPGRLLVEPFHFREAHPQPAGFLLQQFPVIHVQL